MTHSNVFLRLLAPIVLALMTGCASAYNSYSDCDIPCRYCAPHPLPYTQYPACACHSHAASQYLAIAPQVIKSSDEPAAGDVTE